MRAEIIGNHRLFTQQKCIDNNWNTIPWTAEYFLKKHGEQRGFFNLKSSKLSYSALSDSFEYLCYGSGTIINMFTVTVPG